MIKMDDDQTKLEELAELPLETLYARLGEHTGIGFAPWNKRDLEASRRRAVAWLQMKRADLQATICGNPALRNHFSEGSVLNLASAAAMVMQLVKPVAIPGTAAVVAWILVREGINKLCSECWREPPSATAPADSSASKHQRSDE